MKTIAHSDNNQIVMTLDKSTTKSTLEEQYGEGYFGRVYRTSLLVFAIAAALAWGRGGLPGLVGLAYGAAISLGSLRAIEIVVRGLFRPEVRLNRRVMVALLILKLPLLAVVLGGAAWLIVQQIANPFALVGGVALVQAVMFLKAVGSLLGSQHAAEPARVPAPWMKAEHWRALAAGERTQPDAETRSRGAQERRSGEPAWAARPDPLPAPE
jgi:hypothetical protein